MSTKNSGLTFTADATDGEHHHLHVGVSITGPFLGRKLVLRFPRWVPGSYFMREPMQHLFNFSAVSSAGKELRWKRVGVDGIEVSIPQNTESIKTNYTILAAELSVRSTHLDSTHLHLMPPFTWMMPEKGISQERLNMQHEIVLTAPSQWTPATQFESSGAPVKKAGTATWSFSAPNRDHLLDGIIEINENESFTHVVDGRTHHLKIWDSGGHQPNQERLDCFIVDMERIIKEHHALFGLPKWGTYTTVLHLTDTGRGGLEHLNSQTSMMPRKCLYPGHDDEYRDLVSLFSHEYLHQWNVKRLRPKNFLNYDLQKEVHTDLLWWFEGGTSWLGDMLCVRSGAWSEDDWRKDFQRKMKRHTGKNGMHRESLSESSHDAWIHLYRSGPYTRESQISYYLEGELAIMCLDVELQKRSKGTYGACEFMAELCNRFALDYESSNEQGVDYKSLRKTLKEVPGGKSLGPYLDRLVHERTAPDIKKAMKFFRLDIVPEKSEEDPTAWLGVGLRDQKGKVIITTYHSGSPLRTKTQVGDELIALDQLRIQSLSHLTSVLKGRQNTSAWLDFSHEGMLKRVEIKLPGPPQHEVKLSGKGNAAWRAYIMTRQDRA
ncbi:PDZ domain-containing protein [Candidatus Poseidonia alphae]|uniref:M61 family metallopeptidase n=1 Tax=Candidatus Poseidonia alphae TaxID=1915863 RepID=UPI0030C6ABBF